jgi:hypothetical protein
VLSHSKDPGKLCGTIVYVIPYAGQMSRAMEANHVEIGLDRRSMNVNVRQT